MGGEPSSVRAWSQSEEGGALADNLEAEHRPHFFLFDVGKDGFAFLYTYWMEALSIYRYSYQNHLVRGHL